MRAHVRGREMAGGKGVEVRALKGEGVNGGWTSAPLALIISMPSGYRNDRAFEPHGRRGTKEH
jgi:hypothetical protein